MTGRRGQPALRQLALFAALCAAALAVGWALALQPASAAQSCTITGGGLQGNNPAHQGDPVLATAQLSGVDCRNSGGWIDFEANGRSVDQQGVTSAKAYYSVLRASNGHTVVSAVLWNGDSRVLGTIDVAQDGGGGGNPTPTPPQTRTTTVPAPPRTSTRAAPSATSSARTRPSTSTSKAKLVPVVVIPSFGGDDLSASDTPTPSAAPSTSDAESGVAYKVGVIHGDGSVDPIPAGLLIATVVLVGGLLGAAAHFVRAHQHEGRRAE